MNTHATSLKPQHHKAPLLTVLHTCSGKHYLDVTIANTFFSRFKGLMLKAELPEGQGLLLPDCSSIHTCFMRFAIDLLYLNHKGIIIQCASSIQPWAMHQERSAQHILELPAGSIERYNVKIGDTLKHPYFQVSLTSQRGKATLSGKHSSTSHQHSTPIGDASIFRQRGAAMTEFVLAAPFVTLIGLAIIEYGLLFFAKNQMNHAAFMAARAGSMNHADPAVIAEHYVKALIPLYGGGTSSQELLASYNKAQADSAAFSRIEILNPTRESYDDWNDPAVQAKLHTKQRVIPFASQAFKDAGNIRAQSGQNILDANILKIRITHGYRPKVGLIRLLTPRFLTGYGSSTPSDPFQQQLIQQGRIPVVSSVTIHMQSEAIEAGDSSTSVSNPGMGNDGHPVDPGMPDSEEASPDHCLTVACTVEQMPPMNGPLGGSNSGSGESCTTI